VTATFTRYEDFMASLGNPGHHVMIGPDWWGCLCTQGGWDTGSSRYLPSAEIFGAGGHASDHNAGTVSTTYGWADVEDSGSMADLHRWLWESEAF
jgi:hypothetical protein